MVEVDAWVDLAERHEAWARVAPGVSPGLHADRADRYPPGDGVGPALLRGQTIALVGRLAAHRSAAQSALADDPWQDPGFAARMTDQVRRLLPPDLTLLPAEAALLVTVPFLHEAWWSGLAAQAREVGPQDLTPSPDATSDRAAFLRFAQGYPRLHRRATVAALAGGAVRAGSASAMAPAVAGGAVRAGSASAVAPAVAGRTDASAEIGWWMLHRWIGRQAAAYQASSIAGLLAPVEGSPVFAPARLAELLRALRADPGFLARTDRDGALVGRDRVLGYILAIAHALAVETVALPEVIVEHLGIGDPVGLPELRDTVADAVWQPRGTVLVLGASCAHPAVEVALRGHVELVNQLLTEAQRAAAEEPSLKELPTHVTTEALHPGDSGGVPAYSSAGIRFRLAEDRVQELLMGKQLYGDPGLAIRELYQNSLDACRYREARTEYLWRTRDFADGWQGRIRFAQGNDEHGRAYLDCVDNGVGMGVRELGEVFAQAGVRLADLPEFGEEQAEWARLDPPVRLYPNSRFGIGVLSYFMLADEITVDTCRLGRDGRPGDALRVSIAGPGNLFRIRNLGPGTDAGTTVRLHLRSEGQLPDCVETLRGLLWVADFHTEAVNGTAQLTWRPGELSVTAPLGGQSHDEVEQRPAVVPAAGATVWWCEGDGGILADGLWAGQETFGAVVNLSRDLAPQLSVDRTKMLSYREEDVDRLLREAVPAVSTPESPVLTMDWMYSLAEARPLIADMILDWALAAGHRHWPLSAEKRGKQGREQRRKTVDVSVAGCFPLDNDFPSGPPQVVAWRLTALTAAGRYRSVLRPMPDWAERVVRAHPSDALILSRDLDASQPWLEPAEPVRRDFVLRAGYRTGRSAADVADRLVALGFTVEAGYETLGTDSDDLALISSDLDAARPWLNPAEPVQPPHLLRAAQRLRRPVRDLAARLIQVGFTIGVPVDVLGAVADGGVGPDDLILVSRDLDGLRPWLEVAEPVAVAHLVKAAHRTGRTLPEAAARLLAFGYSIEVDLAAFGTGPDDVIMISQNLDGAAPWLDSRHPLPPVQLVRAAQQTGRTVRDVAARMTTLGYTMAGGHDTVVAITVDQVGPDDLVVASRDLDGVGPWLDAGEPVSLPHLIKAAEKTQREVHDIVLRLAALGYTIGVGHEAIQINPDDRVLISRDLDGSDPWLDPSAPVSMAHLVRAARRTERSLIEVAARMAELGFTVDHAAVAATDLDRFSSDDLALTSRDFDDSHPWLSVTAPVPLPHLLKGALRTRRTVGEIAAILAALGHTFEIDPNTIDTDRLDRDDLVLTSRDLDGEQPWLSATEPVPLAHLFAAAKRTKRSMDEVAARLTSIGYQVPDTETRIPRSRPGGQ